MKKFLPWAVALVVLAVGFVAYENTGKAPAASADAQPSVMVSAVTLSASSLPATLTAYGSVMAGPNAETTIAMQASGMIKNIYVTAGQLLAAGDAVATITPDAQSIADYQKAENALATAKISRAHTAALLASHLATNADLATANQTMQDAADALAALDATGAGKTRIVKAPFAGIVSAINLAPGTTQPIGTAILRMIKLGDLVAVTGVPPDAVNAIKPGDPANITLLNAGRQITGQVAKISEMLDQQTGLSDVILSLAGPASLGEPVQAVITTGTLSGYAVPRNAIQNDQQGDYAFQIDAKNIAHRVTVHVLGQAGTQTILAPDLNTAMPLVTTGAYQLDDGVAVRMDAAAGAAN